MEHTIMLHVTHVSSGKPDTRVFSERLTAGTLGESFDMLLETGFRLEEQLLGMFPPEYFETEFTSPGEEYWEVWLHHNGFDESDTFRVLAGMPGWGSGDNNFRNIVHMFSRITKEWFEKSLIPQIINRFPNFHGMLDYHTGAGKQFDEPYTFSDVKKRAFSGVLFDAVSELYNRIEFSGRNPDTFTTENILLQFYSENDIVKSVRNGEFSEVELFFILGSYPGSEVLWGAVAADCEYPRILSLLSLSRNGIVRDALLRNSNSTVTIYKEIYYNNLDGIKVSKVQRLLFNHPEYQDRDLLDMFNLEEDEEGATIAFEAYKLKHPEYTGYPLEWMKEVI